MSHYSVAVITDNQTSVDELLEPYDESINVAPYIYKTKKQIIEEARESIAKLRQSMKDYADNPDEYLKNNRAYWLKDGSEKFVNPPKLSQFAKDELSCEKMNDEEIYQKHICEDTKYDSEGNELSTYNPNSKWDWYCEGGRWDGGLTKKDGSTCNRCSISELAFDNDPETYKKAIHFWEVVVEGKDLLPDEDKKEFTSWYNKEYYIERYGTKEIYAKVISIKNYFYAIVTPDGVWHEPGRMGWFGCSLASYEELRKWDSNFYQDFIEPYNSDEYEITIVDCHI